MASLTPAIIRRIVKDNAGAVKGLKRVGLVGGYARSDYTDTSDMDLIFDLDMGAMNAYELYQH